MKSNIPSKELIHSVLASYTLADLRTLAEESGVSFITLFNLRRGGTPNPGIETVRKFWPMAEMKKGKK